MSEKALIYVAGNPDAYPLEYFQEDTQTYEGVIPQLLREFSAQSNYEIVYYQPDGEDHRDQMAENNQVDLVSGYAVGETAPKNVGTVTLFSAKRNGEQEDYCLYFTDAAPEAFQRELGQYLAGVSQEAVTGLLLDASVPPATSSNQWWLGALGLFAVLLCAVLGLLVRSYRKKLRRAEKNVESDEVTGLGNFDHLARYYKQLINDKNRVLYQAYYFYVDADHLRRISSSQDTDEFLRYCAMVLQEYTGDADILARAADHGFVLLKLTSDGGRDTSWLCTLLGRIKAYGQLYGKPFDGEMHAGIYPLKSQDQNLNEIVFNAAQGAYAAQREDVDFEICSRQMMQQLQQEKQLQASVGRALENREFQLYIQFYVDARSREVVGGEALSRWNHPQKGILMPASFVPLMEREKMIDRLDYYCLREVCAFLQDLGEKGIHHFFISCNFSRETFSAANFVEKAKEIMDQFAFPRELLIFEITESFSAKNVTQIHQNILALKQYGVRVALDDFGEGFTSFYDLHKYPIDGIKLDRGLVSQVMTPAGAAVLRAMVQVGHELGMTILAEGVENEEQTRALQDIQCDVIQGYHFYFPLPRWDAEEKIRRQRAASPSQTH